MFYGHDIVLDDVVFRQCYLVTLSEYYSKVFTGNVFTRNILESVRDLTVSIPKIQVFRRKTSRSAKRNTITVRARRGFATKNMTFSGWGKIMDRF